MKNVLQNLSFAFLLVALNTACTGKLSAIGFTKGSATLPSSSTVPNSILTGMKDCGSPALMTAFSSTYYQFTKTTCVSCHGNGISGRAFGSNNLAEAYASFRAPGTGGFKEVRIIANAQNPLHGSPSTNGAFNKAKVEAAAAEWQRLALAACQSMPTATATPPPGPAPLPPTMTPVPPGMPQTPPAGGAWVFCANENGTCNFSGTATVRFGANGKYASQAATNTIGCSNNVFGDPAPGYQKTCEYMLGAGGVVTPPPAPGATPPPVVVPPPPATYTPPAAAVARGTVVGLRTQADIVASYEVMLGVKTSNDNADSTRMRLYNDHQVLPGYKAQRRYLLPVKSDAAAYNSATQMITIITATEHCNDLINQEMGLGSSSRTFFGDIDMNASNVSVVSTAQIEAMAARFAKKFWRRDLAAEERLAFTGLHEELKGQGTSSRQAMLMMCGMALSSVSSNVR